MANFTGHLEKVLEPGKANEEISNGSHINVKRSDCWSLHSGEWLNDRLKTYTGFNGVLDGLTRGIR